MPMNLKTYLFYEQWGIAESDSEQKKSHSNNGIQTSGFINHFCKPMNEH